jgi:hypothetical protein
MTRVTLDAELRRRLLDLSQPLELCDESGNVVGRFVPAYLMEGQSVEEELRRQQPPLSEEELERRRNSTGPTYTTAEVLAYLENL